MHETHDPRRRRPPRRAALALLSVLALAGPAAAQTYPTRPVTLVIPFAAGGPTDVIGRVLSDRMARSLGQPVVVENVVGASGQTAGTRVSRAAPDGYTLLIGHTGTHAAAVALNPQLRYDPMADFTPVGLVNTNAILVVARKGLAPTNLADFAAYLKANESKVTNAHAGIGSVSHTTCLLLHAQLGVKPTEVPYRGTGPAMNDIVSGQVDYLCDQIVNVAPQVQADTIKAFAVAQTERSPLLPNVPTSVEGGVPGYQVQVWNAMFLPKDTPPAIADKVSGALAETLADPAIRKRFVELGADVPAPELVSGKGLAGFLKAEIDRWTPIIRKAGVTMNP